MERMHEGILYQDQHKRYCLYEPGVASVQKADLHLRMSTGNLAQLVNSVNVRRFLSRNVGMRREHYSRTF